MSRSSGLLLLLFAAACNKPPVPAERVVAVEPAPAPTPVSPPPSASASSTSEEVPGRGACTADADCVLSTYQDGCCTQACESYAINKDELAAWQSKED